MSSWDIKQAYDNGYGEASGPRDAEINMLEQKVNKLQQKLAMAEDAAVKGARGRELGTSLEGCQERMKLLDVVVKEVRESSLYYGDAPRVFDAIGELEKHDGIEAKDTNAPPAP